MYKRYEVTLEDGRVVSKQRANIINNPKAAATHKEIRKRYSSKPEVKERQKENVKKFREKFQEEHGTTYHKWYYNKNKSQDL